MKLRITRKDLDNLTLEQKQNLCDLWIPNMYDPAVATVCIDAAEEKFGQITYVIGGIKLSNHHDMILYDMKFMPDKLVLQDEACPDNIDSDEMDGVEEKIESEVNEIKAEVDETVEDSEQEFAFDEDFNFEFQRPDSFSKQDCLPLLDIGQMIDILERRKFGQGEFYLSASIDEYYFDMGKDDFSSNSSFDSDGNNCELCDVLWESVKALL